MVTCTLETVETIDDRSMCGNITTDTLHLALKALVSTVLESTGYLYSLLLYIAEC